MKSTFTVLFTLLFSLTIFSQTINSVSNGNFLMPTTWDCTCVPSAGYNINVNHTVTMTTSWLQTGGTITVNVGGTLTQDATNRTIAFNGGNLVNNGTVTFSKMAVLTGPLTNSGTLNANDSLFINAAVTNTGTINSANYLNGADLTNSGNINVTNLLNDGAIDNAGSISTIDFYNNNTVTNTEVIGFSNNCTNDGILINELVFGGGINFTNLGTLYNNSNGNINVWGNCTNGDSLNNYAHWYNNGFTSIWNDFTNLDTLDGISGGAFCIGGLSSNFGAVIGDFDICSRYNGTFDLNMGTIANGITFCTLGFTCWENIENSSISTINLFPNPVKEYLAIQFNGFISNKAIQIVNSCGQIVFEKEINGVEELIINRNNLPSGLYILKVSDSENLLTKKLIFN